MSVKEELHQLIEQLGEADADEALAYLRWLTAPNETLSDEEVARVRAGEDQIARGEYVTLAELRRALSE